ncbi:unnamed protein product, partial [Phaeothamnion confervicola]
SSVVLNIRAREEQRDLIDSAAQKLGKNRSEFMLEASCRQAESVLLDQTYFHLDTEAFEEFQRKLDEPPEANEPLQALLGRKPSPKPIRPEHDVSDFDCGHEALNFWLKERALGNHSRGGSRVYVVCESGKVAGYYCLAAGGVGHSHVSAALRKNSPDPLPVLVLGRLAVDKSFAGAGLGLDLVRDAMLRTLQVAELAGVVGLLVHAIDEQARGFWVRKCGFATSPVHPLTLYLSVKTIRKNLTP